MRKHIFVTLAILFVGLLSVACGSDEPEVVPAQEYLTLRNASVEEASRVNADEIIVINCKFSVLVALTPTANITLNGEKIHASCNSNSLDIPVSLEPDMSYKLVVAEGSVCDVNKSSKVNKEFVLTFTTKHAGGEQSLPESGAMEITRKLGFGWNLGNHFDTSISDGIDFTKPKWGYWDGATPTETLYQNLAAAGVQSVRIPVTWGPYQTNNNEYTIDPNFMAEVRKNVLWAKNAGLIVILNTHHDEYWMDAFQAGNDKVANEFIKTRIVATWKQIAETFKNEGSYLILETFNELNHDWKTPTAGEIEIQNEWNQLVVNTIRSTGGQNATRWIAVPSYQASPTYALKNEFQIPTDAAGKLIVAVHCYDPYDFTLRDPLKDTWGTDSDKKAITNVLNKLKAKFIDRDIPCYLGEFGCSMHKSESENRLRRYYLEYFCRAAYFAGLSGCIWDNHNPGQGSEHHAYFSHNDGTWMDNQESIVEMMIKAITSTDPNYTLESIKLRL